MISRIVRTRAPLRISFAGGGSDLSPFVDQYGGEVFASSIGMYAYVTIQRIEDRLSKVIIKSQESNTSINFENFGENIEFSEVDSKYKLAFACFRHFAAQQENTDSTFVITTNSDSPIGSGLGTSSVLTVAIVSALARTFEIELTKFEIFALAYEIERDKLQLRGGRQDHALGAFGGLGSFRFGPNNSLEIDPLEISREEILEFESSLLLVFTGQSRDSASIVGNQIQESEKNLSGINQKFEYLRNQAQIARTLVCNSDIKGLGELLTNSWDVKKSTSNLITNDLIDQYYEIGLSNGAYGGKLCGAGGGGYLLFIAPPECVRTIAGKINGQGVITHPVELKKTGVEVWESRI